MWLSFTDGSRPKGTQFLGLAIVECLPEFSDRIMATLTQVERGHPSPGSFDDTDLDMYRAMQRVNELGINPGGGVQGIVIPDEFIPPMEYRNRLLTSEEDLNAVEAVQLEQG